MDRDPDDAPAPDLVVMDLALPLLDGWEASRRLKSNPLTRHIPILALTGHVIDVGSKTALSGCDGLLTKPCLPEKLVEEAQRLMTAPRLGALAKLEK